MRSHQQIINDVGPEKIADAFGVSLNTSRSWARRDSIPGDFWMRFTERKWASLTELAEYAAANPRKRPEPARAA